MSGEVVGLGAWCDYVTDDQYGVESPRQTLHFRVEEFATLPDGRRLTLARDRGWSAKRSGGMAAEELWTHQTVETLESDVRNVVLPDDAEQTGDEHRWEWLAGTLRTFGVVTTAEELRKVPYEVVLSPRLLARVERNR